MTTPLELRIGNRTIWLVPGTDVESWTCELAETTLRAAATEWPDRRALLQLSDDLHGPAESIAPALAFLADAFDRGSLLAIRLPDEATGLSTFGPAPTDWDDLPSLADLRNDPPTPGARDPRAQGDRRDDPRADSGSTRGDHDAIDPSAQSFVAFVVVDQHGNPLTGRSRCRVDAADHDHELVRETIEIRPIPVHAHVQLELTELALAPAPPG